MTSPLIRPRSDTLSDNAAGHARRSLRRCALATIALLVDELTAAWAATWTRLTYPELDSQRPARDPGGGIVAPYAKHRPAASERRLGDAAMGLLRPGVLAWLVCVRVGTCGSESSGVHTVACSGPP